MTHRRTAAAAAVVLGVLLAGCGAERTPAADAPAPPPPPAASPAADPPPGPAVDVPVRSAALDAAAAADVVPPVSLALPALGVSLPVDPVGVEADGQMEIPPLAERAGWYRFGATAGDATGTAVVAAHVDSVASAGLGPFARLADSQVGDRVDVTLADGTTVAYAVTAVERQAKPEVAWPDVFRRDGAHRLVLITCGGTFQRDQGHYSDNVLVTAEPVGG